MTYRQILSMFRQAHPAIFAIGVVGAALLAIAFVAIGATALVDIWQPLVIVRSGMFIVELGVLGAGGILFLGAEIPACIIVVRGAPAVPEATEASTRLREAA